MTKKNLSPIHPGEILLEEFMKPMNISQYKLAKQLHVRMNLQASYDLEKVMVKSRDTIYQKVKPLKNAA